MNSKRSVFYSFSAIFCFIVSRKTFLAKENSSLSEFVRPHNIFQYPRRGKKGMAYARGTLWVLPQ